MRVLHCPTTTGGHPGALAAAERELGLDSRCVALRAPFGHGADEILYRPGDGALRRQARRWGLAVRALRKFDVVHFNSGSTCLPHASPPKSAGARDWLFHGYSRLVQRLDLRLLHAAGVAVAVTFQGSDARQSSFFERHLGPEERDGLEPYLGRAKDRHKRRLIDDFARYAGHVFYLNPDLATVLPAEHVSFLPYATSIPPQIEPTASGSRFTIAHAPSNRAVKGTRAIIDAVRSLGNRVDLDLIEGVTHAEALARLARADLVIDQVVLGWYGATAVEAMSLGRPVLATIFDDYLDHVPPGLVANLPIVRAPRRELATVLTACLQNRSDLEARGRAGPSFVAAWHDPVQVARQTRAVYERLVRR